MITILLVLAFLQEALASTNQDWQKVFCPFQWKRARQHLDPELLEHGGLDEIRKILSDQRREFGPCRALRTLEPNSFELIFDEAVVPLELTFGEKQKIRNVFFGAPRIKNDSLERIKAQLKTAPYRISFYAGTEAGEELLAFNPDDPLSISRANQIFLLRAAITAIEQKKLKLSDLAVLEEQKIVPALGIIHFWKPGSLISVDSLLNLMVAEKDLTASDLLLSLLPQEQLWALGQKLRPFLSYREYFLLSKLPKEKLQGGSEAIANLLPSLSGRLSSTDTALDRPDLVKHVGWFASTRELCGSALLAKEEILSRNTRLNGEYKSIQPKEIEQLGIVQSRDSGISQLTMIFQSKGEKSWRCLALTANHSEEVEEGFFSALAVRLTNLLVPPPKKESP